MDEGLRGRGGQTENRGAEHRGHPLLITRRLLEESETRAVNRTIAFWTLGPIILLIAHYLSPHAPPATNLILLSCVNGAVVLAIFLVRIDLAVVVSRVVPFSVPKTRTPSSRHTHSFVRFESASTAEPKIRARD